MWDGDGSGWAVAMAIGMVAFWVLIALVALAVLRGSNPSPRDQSASRLAPEDVLHERYAKGEIDDQEYQQRLATLRSVARQRGDLKPNG